MSTSKGRIGLSSLVIAASVFGYSPAAFAQARPPAAANEVRITLLQAKPRAYAVVESTAGHEQSYVRLAGLEAAQYAPDAALELARAGLVDENPAVRFAALVTVGKLRLARLSDAAVDLMRDENPSVRAAAMFAAKRCGKEVDLSPMGGMLASSNPTTRANAAMLVGQLGDPQAVDMLREMAGQPMSRVTTDRRAWVRLQFAEAMIRLAPDDAEVLSMLRAAVFSNYDQVRVLAIQVLGEIGDRSVLDGFAALVEGENPLQIKIAAAQALTQMGDPRGVKTLMQASAYDSAALQRDLKRYIREIGQDTPEALEAKEILDDQQLRERSAAAIRAQAATALSWVSTKAAAERLAKMLDDSHPIVRVAAASAVLRAAR